MEYSRSHSEFVVSFFRANFRLRRLNNCSGREIACRFGTFTRQQFRNSDRYRLPVLIAARNEAEDLPKLLVALSYSTLPVEPIVIDNDSSDETYCLSEQMGARVLREERIGQISAMRTGFDFLSLDRPKAPAVLITDADSFPLESWAAAASRRLSSFSHESGGVITGSRYKIGKKRFEALYTLAGHLNDLRTYIKENRIKAYGPNLGIRFDSRGSILNALTQLDSRCILGTDNYMFYTVVSSGGDFGYLADARGIVLDKDDRYPTWKDFFLRRLKKRTSESYYTDRLANGESGSYRFRRDGSTTTLID